MLPVCPRVDCRQIRGHTLYEAEKVLVERLDTMLRRLVEWDPVLDNSSDSPELLSGSMVADLLLSPHNRSTSGLLFGAWEAVDGSDDPGTCRCVELKAVVAVQDKQAMDLFNQDEVEVIPLVEVAPTKL